MDDKQISPQVLRESLNRSIKEGQELSLGSLLIMTLGLPAVSLILFISIHSSAIAVPVGLVLMFFNVCADALWEMNGNRYFGVFSMAVCFFIFLNWLVLPGALEFCLVAGGLWQLGSWIWEGFNKD